MSDPTDWPDHWESIGRMLKGLASRHKLTIVIDDKSITTVPERAGDLEALLKILVEWSEKHDRDKA